MVGEILSAKELRKVKSAKIVDTDEGELWLYFEVAEKDKIKSYKRDITNSAGKLEELYEIYVATDLLRQGYLLVPIDGGWIVHGGEEPYQLGEQSCSCMSFLNNRTQRCKHLIFRDFHQHYRNKINEIKKLYK